MELLEFYEKNFVSAEKKRVKKVEETKLTAEEANQKIAKNLKLRQVLRPVKEAERRTENRKKLRESYRKILERDLKKFNDEDEEGDLEKSTKVVEKEGRDFLKVNMKNLKKKSVDIPEEILDILVSSCSGNLKKKRVDVFGKIKKRKNELIHKKPKLRRDLDII